MGGAMEQTSPKPGTPGIELEWSWPKSSEPGQLSQTPSVDAPSAYMEQVSTPRSALTASLLSLIPALIGLGVAFGLKLSGEQQTAIITVATAVTGVMGALTYRNRRS